MRRLIRVAVSSLVLAAASAAVAFDNGQLAHVPADIRAWFKSVVSPSGVPCCDEADGHRKTYEVRGASYWVPIDGLWWEVPERSVIRDRGNPVGEAVVWYVHHGGGIVINCFVPADAV
jgi:hypothetical protein